MSDTQTQSKRGGRRKGAGRKPDPNSIRQTLAKARANNYRHSFTKWEVECDAYINKHGTWLLFSLMSFHDKLGRPLISPHAAYKIAHFPKKEQAKWIRLSHGRKLVAAHDLYKDATTKDKRSFANICLHVYRHGRLPRGL